MIISKQTKPNSSCNEGTTPNVAIEYNSNKVLLSTKPKKVILLQSFLQIGINRSNSPLPAIINRHSECFFNTF